MEYKFNYKNLDDRDLIIANNSNLRVIEDNNQTDEKYIIMTDTEFIPKSEDKINELEEKISILEAENADLLLDSAIKDSKIQTLENDLADLTLEIAMMEVR